jgi:mono/diheme cytochrome c family protein
LIVLFIVAGSVASACGGATPEPAQPTAQPEPTSLPETVEPTEEPAEQPTEAPEEAPTEAATEPPTEPPTEVPAEEPTEEPTQESVAITGEVLLQERCTVCHTLDRVMRAGHSALGWEQTVDRMVKRGAELNDEERTVLIDYLAQTYGQ